MAPNRHSRRVAQRTRATTEFYHSLKAKADARRTRLDQMADWLTEFFGTLRFLLFNIAFFAFWVVINARLVPGLKPIDPYPFSFLTTAVSLEAIILTVVVLISQNRATRVADLRQEVDLQVNVRTETEITKVLELVALLLQESGVDTSQDAELQEMLQPTNLDEIEEVLEQEVSGEGADRAG